MRRHVHSLLVLVFGTLAACGEQTGLPVSPKVAVRSDFNTLTADLSAGFCSAPSFAAATYFPTGAGLPVRATTADFNRDGKLDVVVSTHLHGGLSVFLGDGAGGFGPPTVFPAGVTYPTAIASADFNGDGNLDLVTGAVDVGAFTILLGDGHGSFGPPSTYPVGPGVYMIAIADFNSDGKLDAAVATYAGNGSQLSVLFGDGAGHFAPVQFIAVGGTPITVHTADFNRDGVADLVVGNVESTGNATVLLGNGDGTFRRGASLPPGYALVGDFNSDGRPDVVLTLYGAVTNTVTTFLGVGDGTFNATNTLSIVGGAPSAVGDFDGDGRLDLAGDTGLGHQVFVYSGDGLGGFGPSSYFDVRSQTSPTIAADVNGDGRLDLITPLYPATSFSLLLNNGPIQRTGVLVKPLFDQTKAHKSGSVVPIKVQLLHCDGTNASASDLVVKTLDVEPTGSSTLAPVADAGDANPDGDFRYNATLGSPGGGYIFNLSTKGLAPGVYTLRFTAGSDPAPYSVNFEVR